MTLTKTLLGPARTVTAILDEVCSTGCELARALGAIYSGSSPFAAVDALELTRHVRERVRRRAEAKSVEVVVAGSCGPVWLQPRAFAEALFCLVDGAVEATRPGHPVIVDVQEADDGDVLWQIEDTSEGMSERALAELGQLPRGAGHDGASLRVPVAWAVIENHGGLLRFESDHGVGTTASIWIPASDLATGRHDLARTDADGTHSGTWRRAGRADGPAGVRGCEWPSSRGVRKAGVRAADRRAS